MIDLSRSDTDPSQAPWHPWRTAVFVLVAIACIGSYYLWLYSDCLSRFFFLDDFWEINEAAKIDIRSPLDVWQFLRPVPFFLLYRPLSTLFYFYVMEHLLGANPSAYHGAQLFFNVMNCVLVCGIAGRLFRSRLLGLATALVYAASPGHALAVYWNATFTMTGTVFFYFLGLFVWLRAGSRWRTPVTLAALVAALLASEHGVTFPVSLTLVTLCVAEQVDWRRLAREQWVFYAVAGVYAGIKLVYIRLLLAGFITGPAAFAVGTAYAMHLDPWLVLHNLGQYLGLAVSPLYTFSLQDTWARAFGAMLVGAAVVGTLLVLTKWRTVRPLRMAVLGVDLFVVALGPVTLLQGHLLSYYVGIAALGSSLAIVAIASAIPRLSMVTVPLAVAALGLTHAFTTSSAVRTRQDFALFIGGSIHSEAWLYAVTSRVQSPLVQEVVVPRNPVTEYVFDAGQAHRLLACGAYRVRTSERIDAEGPKPGAVVVRQPRLPPQAAGRGERWSWLRAACERQRRLPPQ